MSRSVSHAAPRVGASTAASLGILGGLLLVLALPGCRIGGDGVSYENENDELRRENLELKREVERFEKDIRLLEGELATQRKQQAGATPIEGAVPPVFSAVAFGRYSGPVDTDADGQVDTLRLYVLPQDQFGRFRTVAGQVQTRLVRLKADAEAEVLHEQTLSPDDLHAAYRSGFTGTHYRVELPLPHPDEATDEQLTAVVKLTETGTGAQHSHQQVYAVK